MPYKIDEILKDILGRVKNNPNLFTMSSRENTRILADMMPTVNLAKCNLFDLDLEEDGSVMYLTYMLQKEGIPFGICQNVQIYRNKNKISAKCLGGKDCPCKGRLIIPS